MCRGKARTFAGWTPLQWMFCGYHGKTLSLLRNNLPNPDPSSGVTAASPWGFVSQAGSVVPHLRGS